MAKQSVAGRKVKRLCEECNEYSYMLIDRKGMLIKYIKPCSCVKEILELRKNKYEQYLQQKTPTNVLQKRTTLGF